MAKGNRPIRFYLFRSAGASLALGLLAAQLAAAPATAQSRGASLSVTATVMPSCVVTTQSGAAQTSCSNFGDGSVRIERERAVESSPPAPVQPAESPNPERRNDVTYVTITY